MKQIKAVFLEKAQFSVGEFYYDTQMLENFKHLTFFRVAKMDLKTKSYLAVTKPTLTMCARTLQ